MNIGIAYVTPVHKVWLKMEMPDGCTVAEAIERSGILGQFPEIDLAHQKVGIFGRITRLDAPPTRTRSNAAISKRHRAVRLAASSLGQQS